MALKEPLQHVAHIPDPDSSDFGLATLDLEAEVFRAKQIRSAQSDLEDDGGPPFSDETLDRAVSFLKVQSKWLWMSAGIHAVLPAIGPGPNGSVDLYWKQPSWELLVNIPAADDELATFYGHNYGLQKTKGSFDPRKPAVSVGAWLRL